MSESTNNPLRCPNCSGDLFLSFENTVLQAGEHTISLVDAPILRCPDCAYHAVVEQLRKAACLEAEKAQLSITIKVKDTGRRFAYAEAIGFEYDYRDYLYIPGLQRPWNEGFLTPIFFSPHVLHKYRNTPSYKVELGSDTYGTISEGYEWSVPFGINRRGEVIMWLGDIAQLPAKEQYYLRSENIPSSHNIASEFYDGQIAVEWGELSREGKLFAARARFVRNADLTLEEPSTHLDEEAAGILATFSPPVDMARNSVIDAILALNKICAETIAREAFVRDLTRRKILVKSGLGSLKVLEMWIADALGRSDASSLMSPLFVLYDLRLLPAHLMGSDTEAKTLDSARSRLGLAPDAELREIYQRLVDELGATYEMLASASETGMCGEKTKSGALCRRGKCPFHGS